MPDPSATQKCPQCQSPLHAGDRFCGVCGATLATGQIPCPSCGLDVPANSQFCGHCGRPIHAPSPEIRRHRWWRSPEEVAVRFDAANLPDLIHGFKGVEKQGWVDWGKEKAARLGLLETGFVIEEGTLAVLFQHGVAEVFGPGSYGGGDLNNRLAQVLAGEPMVLAMMDGGPVELPLAIDDLLTAESVKVAVHCRLVVQIKDPVVFQTVCVKGVKRVTRLELAERLKPEVRLALLDGLRATPAKSLRSGTELQTQLEQRLDEDLRAALQPWGLRLTDVRGLTVRGEVLERFTGQQGQLYERGAQLDFEILSAALDQRELRQQAAHNLERERAGHESDRDAFREQAAHELEMERLQQEREQLRQQDAVAHAGRLDQIDRQLSDLEARREVADHQRQTVTRVEKTAVDLEGEFQESALEVGQAEKLADLYRRAETVKLDRLQTEEDVDKVVAELNKNKALRDDDVETLKQGLLDRREDRELARSYLLKKISLEQELEQQRIRLQAGQEMDAAGVEHELALRRRQFESAQAEERTLHERSVAEERNRIKLAEEADQADLRTLEQMRRLNQSDAEHAQRMEAERLKARSGASVAALLSLMREQGGAASAEVDQTLRELARTEQFKGLSTDAILAMQAGESPEVAKIFQARATAGGYEELMQARLEESQKAVEQERRHSQEMREVFEKHAHVMGDSSAQAMQRITDIAQSVAASSRGETVVVNPPPGSFAAGATVVGRQPGSPAEALVACPACRAMQRSSATFCDHCGARLKPLPDGRPCANCGAPVPPGNRFCPQCGATLG
ncbi:MAG: zinc-ribbon domain-containing protein [Candidatus Anammoximicrobium sp.]|nr:zinc-ribbon domain-containing protein [Candidatus Anammoximicrobium sp.]